MSDQKQVMLPSAQKPAAPADTGPSKHFGRQAQHGQPECGYEADEAPKTCVHNRRTSVKRGGVGTFHKSADYGGSASRPRGLEDPMSYRLDFYNSSFRPI